MTDLTSLLKPIEMVEVGALNLVCNPAIMPGAFRMCKAGENLEIGAGWTATWHGGSYTFQDEQRVNCDRDFMLFKFSNPKGITC